MKLAIRLLRTDGGTQPRAEIDPFIVGDYAEAIQNGAQFPPIIAFFDGSEYWLADGFHRVNACKKAGIAEVEADVHQGTRRDAVLFSVGANATHGLRRTNQDKRRAVETLLRDTEWANWSNNQIAKQCAVSLDLVNRMRKDMSLNETLSERTYTTKHGTTAVMDTAKIGTAKRQLVYDKAPEPVKAHLQDGVISVNEAYEVTRALEQAPEPVKAKVIEQASAGNVPTVQEVKKLVNEERRREEIQQRQEAAISIAVPEYQLGDCRELARGLAAKSVRLLLTDPPYGMSFQSNRRVASPPAPKISGDDDLSAALQLLREMLSAVNHAMTDDCHLLIFTGWRYEPEFRRVIESAGYQIAASLIWHKLDHGSGDLGGFAPAHERIIHARRGSLKISPRLDDVLTFRLNRRSQHPAEKPVELLRTLIECTTVPGELVLDPFAGTGATVLAARAAGRKVSAFELDSQWYNDGVTEVAAAA